MQIKRFWGHWNAFTLGCPAFVFQFLFFCIPLICLIASSLFKVTLVDDHYMIKLSSETIFSVITTPLHISAIINSLELAFFTAFSCLIIAIPITYYIVFHTTRWRKLLIFFLMIPAWNNMLLNTYSWFYILENHGILNNTLTTLSIIDKPIKFLNTRGATLLMMVYYHLPFMIIPIYASLCKLPKSLLEVSLSLGAREYITIKKIVLPLIQNSILVGFFLVFIPSYGEFVIPELMGGDKHLYVGSAIAQYILGEGTAPTGLAFTFFATCVILFISFIILILFHNPPPQDKS